MRPVSLSKVYVQSLYSSRSAQLIPWYAGFKVEHLMDWQIPEADEFFTNQKSVTSDHTLSRLLQPLLAEKELHQLLGDMTLSHKQAVYNLSAEYTHFFTKWMFALRYKGIHVSCVTKFQVTCNSLWKNSLIQQDTVQVSYLTPLQSLFPKELSKKSPVGSIVADSVLLGYNTASLGTQFPAF